MEASSGGRQAHGSQGKWALGYREAALGTAVVRRTAPNRHAPAPPGAQATPCYRPVLPKPPAPRCVPGSSSTGRNVTRSTRAIDHLGDPHPAGDLEGLGAEVHQHDHQLAPVVAVDRRRGVGQRDAVPERQAGPGPDLALEPLRDRDREAGPEQLPLERGQRTRPPRSPRRTRRRPAWRGAGSGRPSPWGSRVIRTSVTGPRRRRSAGAGRPRPRPGRPPCPRPR